jgi:hypothetical protein
LPRPPSFIVRRSPTNKPNGDVARKGAVRKRSFPHEVMGEDIRTGATGKFMDQKKACGEEV